MGYKVTAPLVCARDRSGKVRYHYPSAAGDTVIPWLEEGQAAHLLRLGYVEEVDGSDDASSEGEPAGKPKQVAPKKDWVDWAITQGADPAEAEASSKADLIELYG